MLAKIHFIIIDDDRTFLSLLSKTLSKEGFETTCVLNGEDALRLINERSFDLALLNIRLPGVGGLELLKIIRRKSSLTDCVMISDHLEMQLAIEAIKMGAKDFLIKSQNIDEMVGRLKTQALTHIAEVRTINLQIEFTSKLFHDMLTILQTLRSAIDFLEEQIAESIAENAKKIFQSINGATKSMDILLNNIIDLNLLESGRAVIEKIPINLDELVPAACAPYIHQANLKHIEMSIVVNENVPTIEVDPIKIEQVIHNLLENAIKYTREGGRIKVIVSAIERDIDGKIRSFVEVVVADSGIGIDRVELPFAFDKYKDFLTGKSTDQKTSRLGLAICRRIIEAHNGTINVESEPGKGSSFRLLLPLDSRC